MYPTQDRLPAAIAYIPLIGWLYCMIFTKRSPFVNFHLHQSLGLFVFLAAALLIWGIVTWVLSWIPFGMVTGIVLFTMVIIAFAVGAVAWIMGILNALSGRAVLLPIFGAAAYRLRF